MEDEVSGGANLAVERGFGHMECFGEEAPEKIVHGAGKAGNIGIAPRCRMSLQQAKEFCNAGRGPGVNRSVLPREHGIGEHGFPPSSIGAEVLEIRGESAFEELPQRAASVARLFRPKIELAEFFQQVVHQREQELALRAVVLIEGADSELGTGRNLFNRSALVASLSEQSECRGVQPRALGNTALLRSCWRKGLSG